MNFEYFFLHEDTLIERNLDIGFELYGVGHLAWLAAITAAVIIYSSHYKKLSQGKRDKVKKFFAVAILLSEIYKDIVILIIKAPIINYLPLHLCSFAIFAMLLDAFGRKKPLIKQMFAFAFAPGAAAALLFCNWTCYPFFHFMTIHSFVFHGWIIIYFVMQYRSGEVELTYKGLWKSLAIIYACAVPVCLINKAWGTNYMFLNSASEGSPLVILWQIFGPAFSEMGYLLSYAAFAAVVLNVIYLMYMLLGRIFKKGEPKRENL